MRTKELLFRLEEVVEHLNKAKKANKLGTITWIARSLGEVRTISQAVLNEYAQTYPSHFRARARKLRLREAKQLENELKVSRKGSGEPTTVRDEAQENDGLSHRKEGEEVEEIPLNNQVE